MRIRLVNPARSVLTKRSMENGAVDYVAVARFLIGRQPGVSLMSSEEKPVCRFLTASELLDFLDSPAARINAIAVQVRF